MNEDIREQLQRAQLKAQSRYMERLDRAHKEAKALEERLRKFKRGGGQDTDYRDIVIDLMATAYGLQKTATSMASIAWRLGELETLLGDE